VSRLWPGRADRLIIAPHDLRTADATRAAEIYAGRFVFAGKIVTCHGRSIFDLEPPSEDWEVALLGFGWLRHLRAADTALTRANARSLVDDWISNPARKRPLERRPDVLARRVISLLSQAPLVLGDTDGKFYRKYLRGLTREIRYLRYAMLDIADGVPRLQVLIGLCYASLCLANQARHIRSATRRLSDELQRQIMPDGGHISRNPGALVELLSDLLPLRQTFAARNIAPPPALLNAIDRMMPMLRFFRHGDGSFALFNGMSNAPSRRCSPMTTPTACRCRTCRTPASSASMPAPQPLSWTAGRRRRRMSARKRMPVASHSNCLPDRAGSSSIAACPRPAATTGAALRAAPRPIRP
jgi:uncharacterized heparinase superfamily protein